MRTIKFLLAAGFLLMSGTSIYAQVQRNEAYLPKFAIKTNALYWATSTPNLGFEVGLAKKLTLDISGNYNPWKFGDDRQIKHWQKHYYPPLFKIIASNFWKRGK